MIRNFPKISIKDAERAVSDLTETVVDALSGRDWHEDVSRAGQAAQEMGQALKKTDDKFLTGMGTSLESYGDQFIESAVRNSKEIATDILRSLERWWKEQYKSAKSEYEKRLEAAYKQFRDGYFETYNSVQKDFVEAIGRAKDLINTLSELFDIKKLIQKILDQAEIMLEDYLRDKLLFLDLVEAMGEPDIEISLDSTTLKFEMYTYVVCIDYHGDDYKGDCFLELSLFIEQNVFGPAPSEVNLGLKFYDDRIKADLKERVQNKINEEKDRLTQELITALFSDYIEVFKKFKEYLDLI